MIGVQVFVAAGRFLRVCSLALGLFAGCFCVGNAFAATPENGLYWVPGRPAQAYAIEHQGDRVALVMLGVVWINALLMILIYSLMTGVASRLRRSIASEIQGGTRY